MSMHPTRNLFAEFKGNNRVFVETGMYRGDGIQLAMDAGYEKIISIDIDPVAVDFCMQRFDMFNAPKPWLKLYQGDSAVCLGNIIQHIDEPITFWLDSHWQMLEGTEPGPNPFPLLKELAQISATIPKNPTIIIDDMLIMQKDIVGYDRHDIVEALRDIQSTFLIDFFPNPVIDNILVAHL